MENQEVISTSDELDCMHLLDNSYISDFDEDTNALNDPFENAAYQEFKSQFWKMVNKRIKPQHLEIFVSRVLDGQTVCAIANEHHLSQQRISQICNTICERLRHPSVQDMLRLYEMLPHNNEVASEQDDTKGDNAEKVHPIKEIKLTADNAYKFGVECWNVDGKLTNVKYIEFVWASQRCHLGIDDIYFRNNRYHKVVIIAHSRYGRMYHIDIDLLDFLHTLDLPASLFEEDMSTIKSTIETALTTVLCRNAFF
jgi:hypothetical protein